MKNQILDTIFDNHNFVGYLAVDHENNILFGYDAEWAQKDGYSPCGEYHTGYTIYSFSSEEEAREWLAEQNFR